MRQVLLLFLFTHLFLSGVSKDKPGLTKLSDGIIVYPTQAIGQVKQVIIQVVAEDIIKVTAATADSSVHHNSLVAINQPAFNDFTVEDKKDIAIVSTRSLIVEVSLITGEIVFKDRSGRVVLQEKEGGGKFLEEKVIDNSKIFSIRQVFESPEDEAFYGLGGHQNGQMNYKGQDVELAQHNIVDVVPFLYSSRHYGLLWDNYSISHFGDAREYQSLNSLTLFSQKGREGGLTANYYVKDEIVRTATESTINYEFLETPEIDNFPKNVAQQGKVVWEGSFTSDKDGVHKFLTYSSGYLKVWVDGKLVVDKWRQNWNPWTNKFTVDIKKGARHQLKIEWICEGGYMAFKHLDPISPREQSQLTLSSEAADHLVYYFIKGNNADDVIQGYRTLTGKAPIVPSWALGFWQSRERYRTQEELINVVKEYRKRGIPLDNIVLDWQYWEDPKWGSHEFDHTRFPDPKGMVNTLHDQLHAQIMISVWPKFNKGTKHFDELNKNGFLFKRNIEMKRKDWVGEGYESTFYDPFNPEAGELFWKQMDDKLNVLGIDAWWLDATEPDMHSNLSIEERKINMSPTAMGPGVKYFNAYSLLNSKNVYEGQRQSSPNKRVFILTRSSFAGQQRYGAATWSGDIVSRWSDLKDQISAGVNFSISGIPYWTMDIGGFAVESRYQNATGEVLDEWQELNTRWFQFGAFCPLFRSHGQYPYREIFNIAPEGTEVYNSLVYYDKLRYRLMPYLYSLAGQTYHKDYTIMRGMIMDFPKDESIRNINDQFMLGPALLVNPVYEYKARTRSVYLPDACGWYDLHTGSFYKGGQLQQATAPLQHMPVFVREGSIIPITSVQQYVNQKPNDPITLYVYTGANGEFELYEDEGINYNYEKGKYSAIPLQYDEQSGILTIGKRTGSFDGMLKERVFNVVWISAAHPKPLTLEGAVDITVKYSGEAIQVNAKK